MQTGEARVDRKQTASPVAVNEVEVEVNVDDVEAVEANATAPGSRPPAPGFFLDAFIVPFETSAVRIKITIAALVIGLVWKGAQCIPFEGIGKPEPLRENLSGFWSGGLMRQTDWFTKCQIATSQLFPVAIIIDAKSHPWLRVVRFDSSAGLSCACR